MRHEGAGCKRYYTLQVIVEGSRPENMTAQTVQAADAKSGVPAPPTQQYSNSPHRAVNDNHSSIRIPNHCSTCDLLPELNRLPTSFAANMAALPPRQLATYVVCD